MNNNIRTPMEQLTSQLHELHNDVNLLKEHVDRPYAHAEDLQHKLKKIENDLQEKIKSGVVSENLNKNLNLITEIKSKIKYIKQGGTLESPLKPREDSAILLFFGLIIGFSFISAAVLKFVDFSLLNSESFDGEQAICKFIIPSVLISLSLGFLASLSWALIIYFQMRDSLWPQISQASFGDPNIFQRVASRHGQLSQLWFSISVAVLLGAVIFAIFQVSQKTCEKVWFPSANPNAQTVHHKALLKSADYSDETTEAIQNLPKNTYTQSTAVDVSELIINFLSKLFIYSLFFASWMWSIRNYRAHWHAYISNEYRHTALTYLKDLYEHAGNNNEKASIIAREVELIGSIPLSAYLDKEVEETTAQKILRLEERIEELLTKSHK